MWEVGIASPKDATHIQSLNPTPHTILTMMILGPPDAMGVRSCRVASATLQTPSMTWVCVPLHVTAARAVRGAVAKVERRARLLAHPKEERKRMAPVGRWGRRGGGEGGQS